MDRTNKSVQQGLKEENAGTTTVFVSCASSPKWKQ